MPLYESTFIARHDISSQQVEGLAETFTSIVKENGGDVTKTELWGLKTLAYRIKKNRKGHYVFFNIDAPSAAVQELERNLRLNEDVLRYLTVRVDELSPDPSPMMQARASRDERSRRGPGHGRPRGEFGEPRGTGSGAEAKPADDKAAEKAEPAPKAVAEAKPADDKAAEKAEPAPTAVAEAKPTDDKAAEKAEPAPKAATEPTPETEEKAAPETEEKAASVAGDNAEAAKEEGAKTKAKATAKPKAATKVKATAKPKAATKPKAKPAAKDKAKSTTAKKKHKAESGDSE